MSRIKYDALGDGSPLADLVQALKRLPGVGQKSAQRLAFHLLQHNRSVAEDLGKALLAALVDVRHCDMCNNFSHSALCPVCSDDSRNARQLCVLETPADLVAIESTRTYKGFYYVLMGKASPLDGVHPDMLDWPKLARRLGAGVVEEVILATNFTTEGEATAVFLSDRIRRLGVNVSRLARGVPIGGELEYTDPTTLARALFDRRPSVG